MGWLASQAQRRLDDPPVQITISLLTPFAAYLPAEQLGVSGVLSVVTTGLYLGWRAPDIINSRVRLQAGPVWEMIVFLLNGLVFILIGLQLPAVLKGLQGKTSIPHFAALLVCDADQRAGDRGAVCLGVCGDVSAALFQRENARARSLS